MILYECSDRYDSRIMDKMMGDLYVQYVFKANSLNYGMIGPRSRLYGVLILKTEVLVKFSSLENVIPLFYRVLDESASPLSPTVDLTFHQMFWIISYLDGLDGRCLSFLLLCLCLCLYQRYLDVSCE